MSQDGSSRSKRIAIKILKLYVPPLAVILVLGYFFQIANSAFNIPTFLVAPPSQVFSYAVAHTQLIYNSLIVSAEEILGGFAIAAAAGILAATGMVYSGILRNTIYPLISGLNVVPKVAIAPVLILWLGIGHIPIMILTATFCFFPIIINTMQGLVSVEPEMLDLAHSLKAKESTIFLKMRFPNALPQIFSGLQIGINLAVIGAIVGEFVAGQNGLGYVIDLAAGLGYTPEMYAALMVLIALGILCFLAVVLLDRFTLKWFYLERSLR